MISVSLHRYVSTKIFQKQPFADVLQNRCSYKFRRIHKKRSVPLPVLFCYELFNIFPFLQNTFRGLLLKFVEYPFLESQLVSLGKSMILLHRRCLLSAFSEILILVWRKIFSAFSNKTFSNSCGFNPVQAFLSSPCIF